MRQSKVAGDVHEGGFGFTQMLPIMREKVRSYYYPSNTPLIERRPGYPPPIGHLLRPRCAAPTATSQSENKCDIEGAWGTGEWVSCAPLLDHNPREADATFRRVRF